MTSGQSHVFAFPYTFLNRDHGQVISELQDAGVTGVNLALNYHASRDFLLRQGPSLAYLADGFHYYKPDFVMYPESSLRPSSVDHWPSNDLLEAVGAAAKNANFTLAAWGVFLHNSAVGKANPKATVTNALGNHFLSELCPSNPGVQGYVQGLVADLSSRGIAAIAMESLHFHGARHGEHHERFFMELSATTEFLFSLCFCEACTSIFESRGGDSELLKNQVVSVLQPFLTDRDPWLNLELSEDLLKEILGNEISDYLRSREQSVTSLYAKVHAIAKESHVQLRLVDQTPLLDLADNEPLDSSWLVGIDYKNVQNHVDVFEPLVYRSHVSDAQAVTQHYRKRIEKEIIPILRPTFPDNLSEAGLNAKVSAIQKMGVKEIDFYLLDTMRPRDLGWIKSSLT